MMILFIIVYLLGVCCYVFTYLVSNNVHIISITSINLILNVAMFVLSIISPHGSSFVVSLPILYQAMHFPYFTNYGLQAVTNLDYQFNTGCYYAFASIAGFFTYIGITCCNTVELTFRPLFNGIKNPQEPDFGSLISDEEDDDI